MARHIPRIYISELGNDLVSLPNRVIHHIRNVMRLRENDTFLAFNEKEGEWICKIINAKKNTVTAKKISRNRTLEQCYKKSLAICQLKPVNMKLVIEKCTELGVNDFYLLTGKYTNYHNSTEKLQEIAYQASEQSERLDIPKIHNEVDFGKFINRLPAEYNWYVALERLQTESKIDTIRRDTNIGFIVGSEGGFSDDERDILCSNVTAISLSKNILRSETAAISCLVLANMIHND